MREIKFKIYADGRFYDKCLVGNTNNMNDNKWICPMIWLEDSKEWVHCDNGVILQYTGLHDKNGKEIYEGDIIKLHYIKNGLAEQIAKVTYSEDYAQYVITETKCAADEYEPLCDYEDIEVIGNEYDNPELLEREE